MTEIYYSSKSLTHSHYTFEAIGDKYIAWSSNIPPAVGVQHTVRVCNCILVWLGRKRADIYADAVRINCQ